MSSFDKDKVKLAALNYAEQNKIVNQKSIQAFVAGFNLRDNSDCDTELSIVYNKLKGNHDKWKDDCMYGDLRGHAYSSRESQGSEALEIANKVQELRGLIKIFNKKFDTKY